MTKETLPEALRIAGCLRQAGEQHHISIAVITEAERLIQAQHARIAELEACRGCAVQQGYKPAEALQGIGEPAGVMPEPDGWMHNDTLHSMLYGDHVTRLRFPVRRLSEWDKKSDHTGIYTADTVRALLAGVAPVQAAGAAQAVEPYAVLVREIGESSFFDSKPIKPGSVQHQHAKSSPHYDYVELYAHPAPQAQDVQAVKLPQWLPIESAHKNAKIVLLGYTNENGRWRTARGQWFSTDYIAEHWENDEASEGWYETPAEGEECYLIQPTHWMPLPPPPAIAAQAAQGGE